MRIFFCILFFINFYSLHSENKLRIQHDSIKGDLFYNYLDQEFQDLQYYGDIDSNGNIFKSYKIHIKYDTSYIKYDDTVINVSWVLTTNTFNKKIQYGSFRNSLANGKFVLSLNLFNRDSSYCNYIDGLKEGIQVKLIEGYQYTCNYRKGKEDGISYSSYRHTGLINWIIHYKDGIIIGKPEYIYYNTDDNGIRYQYPN
jgi:hypothetical protein